MGIMMWTPCLAVLGLLVNLIQMKHYLIKTKSKEGTNVTDYQDEKRTKGRPCIFEGKQYESRSIIPNGCNTCQCRDGVVTRCTEVGCIRPQEEYDDNGDKPGGDHLRNDPSARPEVKKRLRSVCKNKKDGDECKVCWGDEPNEFGIMTLRLTCRHGKCKDGIC